jgi:Transcriptional regulatory protein, C terminal
MTERMAIGTQLLNERDIPAGPERPWEQGDPVEPGREGTLLAVVPLPGTGTSLAVVGYVVSTGAASDTPNPIAANPIAAAPVPAPAPSHAQVCMPPQALAPGHARASGPLIVTPRGMMIDDAQRRLWLDGAEVPLTFQEFELLAFLVAHPATVFSRAELAAQVWHREFGNDSRTVDVHVSRLRAKMGPVYGRFLVTEYRVGYQYRPPRP